MDPASTENRAPEIPAPARTLPPAALSSVQKDAGGGRRKPAGWVLAGSGTQRKLIADQLQGGTIL